MGDILSQAEIDALLNALSEGQVDTKEMDTANTQKKIRIYDFKRPNKFSKDHIHSLQNIFDKYCRSLTTYFAGHLHAVIDTKVLSIEQITYDEFIRSMPNPTILALFTMNPLEGTVLMEMSSGLAFLVVERLLGGLGQGMEKNRDLTEIEHTIIEHRLAQMISLLQEAWEEAYEINPQFAVLETNPQFTQIVAPNEMIVLITVEVNVGEMAGMINICLPYLVLEPILDKLSTLFLFSTQSRIDSSKYVGMIRQKIEQAKVEMTAFLGDTEILVKDLLNLAPGDVIPLIQNVQEPLPIFVGNFVKFKGLPGLSGDHLAVQLVEIVKDGGGQNG